MTGFGRSEIELTNGRLIVEIKSVNHRFLDMSLHLPKVFNPYEQAIKHMIQKYFRRGRIELYLMIENGAFTEQTVTINWALLDQYHKALQDISSRFTDQAEWLLPKLPELTDIFQLVEKSELDQELVKQVISTIEATCLQVNQMREQEGQALMADISSRINVISDTVLELTDQREQIRHAYYNRMVERLDKLLEHHNIKREDRFFQELAILAEKGDITEELTRINSHLNQMKELFVQSNEIGRKLDFIVQELGREANTIGAKANDVKIGTQVVWLKAEIEKVKEQVQNIE